jgi:hypothetical protein
MARFNVPIEGEDLDRAWAAFNGTPGIETVGRPLETRFASGPPERGRTGRLLTAALDADTAIDAEARVREALPRGEYVVGQAEEYGD